MDDTNRVFFDRLEAGRYVKAMYDFRVDGDVLHRYTISNGTEYIWTGKYVTGSSQRTHAIVIEAGGQLIRYVDLSRPQQFKEAWRDAESYRRATDYELFLLTALINHHDAIKSQESRIEALTTNLNEYRTDVEMLSSDMNVWADEFGYESEFDDAVAQWNKAMSRIHLLPREFDHEVVTRVTVSYDVRMKVKAKSSNDAMDKVLDMNGEDVYADHIKDRYDAPHPTYDIETVGEPTRV